MRNGRLASLSIGTRRAMGSTRGHGFLDGSGMEQWREGKRRGGKGKGCEGGGIRGVVGEQSWGAGELSGKKVRIFFSLDRWAQSEKGGEGRGWWARRKEVRERRLRERGKGGVSSNCVAPTLAGSAGLRKAPHWGRRDVRLRLPSVIVREDEERVRRNVGGAWTMVLVR